MQPTLLDKGISVVIILFILSMISERFITWLKLYYGQLGKTLLGFSTAEEDFTKSNLTEQEKNRKEQKILGLNISVSIIIAILSYADLFKIINSDKPNEVLGWKGFIIEHWWNVPVDLLGCILTGFFISLGSKFWHDLLDTLLEAKNLKRKLSDERTFTQPQTIQQFDEFIKLPENRLSSIAFEKYGDSINQIPGVLSVGPGYLDTPSGKTGCLEVHLVNNEIISNIPSSYSITLSSGMSVSIPVNKIVTGHAVLHNETLGSGSMVGNENRPDVRGTIGCIVTKNDAKDNRKFILSCHHVLNGDADLSRVSDKKEIKIVTMNGEVSIAELVDGERSDIIDAGIAFINNDNLDLTNETILNPKTSRKVTSLDAINNTQIRIYGGSSEAELQGVIHNESWPVNLYYKDKDFITKDLIVITRFFGGKYNGITQKGDSGSLVVDNKTNKALGIVVGGDESFTYAIKMTNIEKRFNIKLI